MYLDGPALWIIAIGILVCSSCGLIGSFLILKKMALMGDAISHAVLPGIVLAVVISGGLNPIPIFIGAGIIGILTPFLIESLNRSKLVHEDASTGSVFTLLFAIGVIMVTNMGNVDVDTECVLYGEIATTFLDTVEFSTLTPLQSVVGKIIAVPRAFITLAIVFLLNLGFVLLFYKELKISTFDEELAASMGMRPRVVHYLLMTMVAITTVGSFESVGAIIVVAMLIAPGASAYLLTDRLGIMLVLATLLGAVSAIGGYFFSAALGGDVSIAGCMAIASGVIFALAFFFSPTHGVIRKSLRRASLKKRLLQEHLLINLYHRYEDGQKIVTEEELLTHQLTTSIRKTCRKLVNVGFIFKENTKIQLTEKGLKRAQNLIRAHRLWESYVHNKMGLPSDHVHRPADEMEHFLSPELMEKLEHELEFPRQDPHGKPIPNHPNGES